MQGRSSLHPVLGRADMSEFNWPCNKREAHGPHRAKVENPSVMLPTNPPKKSYQFIDCPGVKAHPKTMIGKGELK